ncbi:MAG: diacylglycerol kinase [Spirochaetaceae bacterium]|jgi:diacylglycerol kinase family enzyme|nr:diacylglycerol kinase [Spirochaetaceae bacterium]
MTIRPRERSLNKESGSKLQSFAFFLRTLITRSLLVPDKALRWTLIANPVAGGFTINRRWNEHRKVLQRCGERVRQNRLRQDAQPSRYALSQDRGDPAGWGQSGLIPTGGPGHAASITRALAAEAEENEDFYLIITAGGDGTSLEVLQTLCQVSEGFRSRCAVLRLPMGTGNDGADAWELETALELLMLPSRIEMVRGLTLSTAGGKTWPDGSALRAFNILSLGLDAFVTHMTNKMKGSLPGDSYKLWVDVASILYDRLYRVETVELRGFKEGKELIRIREKILLCAMGVSGRRSYGSHKMILPDERNVCAVKQMPLLRKIALKGLFTTGAHVDKKESILFSADRIEFRGEYPVLAQMDGETVLLEPGDFPAVIELTGPVIPVLRRR